MLNIDKHQEHLDHSAYDHAEAFAGFDRGDTGRVADSFCGTDIISSQQTESGSIVQVVKEWQDHEDFGYCEFFEVRVNGERVSEIFGQKNEAVEFANWWLDGCPA